MPFNSIDPTILPINTTSIEDPLIINILLSKNDAGANLNIQTTHNSHKHQSYSEDSFTLIDVNNINQLPLTLIKRSFS